MGQDSRAFPCGSHCVCLPLAWCRANRAFLRWSSCAVVRRPSGRGAWHPWPFLGFHVCCGYPRDCAWVRGVLGAGGLASPGPNLDAKARSFASFLCLWASSFSELCFFFWLYGPIHPVCFLQQCSSRVPFSGVACRLVWCVPSLTCDRFGLCCLISCLFCSSDLTRVSLSSPSCTCVCFSSVLPAAWVGKLISWLALSCAVRQLRIIRCTLIMVGKTPVLYSDVRTTTTSSFTQAQPHTSFSCR